MHRRYFYLAALVAITTAPVSALAEMVAAPVSADTQSQHSARTAGHGIFYIDIPAANYPRLIGQIKTYLAALTDREEEITRYLDENQLDAKDALITAIMPGGLLYAALRNNKLELARTELAEITEVMDELSRDLLAMQLEARELTVAQLQ